MYKYLKIKADHRIGPLHYITTGLSKDAAETTVGEYNPHTKSKQSIPNEIETVDILTDYQYQFFLRGYPVWTTDDRRIHREGDAQTPLIGSVLEIYEV
jgi:hypothetical protein